MTVDAPLPLLNRLLYGPLVCVWRRERIKGRVRMREEILWFFSLRVCVSLTMITVRWMSTLFRKSSTLGLGVLYLPLEEVNAACMAVCTRRRR